MPGSAEELQGKYAFVRIKFSQPRFLDVLRVPPFSPHSGGSLYSPVDGRSRLLTTSPLVKVAGTSSSAI